MSVPIRSNRAVCNREDPVKQQLGKQDVRAVAEKGLAASKDFYDQACALATDGAKAITEVADMVWGNSKTLNEKAVQNVTQNMEAALTAASEIAAAKSLLQVARLQSEYLQALASRATEQTKEFVDLSGRAAQDVFEKVQAVAARPFKPSH
jgi:hypothetical protein